MEIETKLREDLWKAIQAHYERTDYTEAVRDAMFQICELLREKSGLVDKDGTKLVEAALMGTTPAILVNKYETTTEKDVQQGIGFALKGLMQAVRNPMSHEVTAYTQNDADAIILYSNYLLNRIDLSGGTRKVDDVMELLYDEDFTDTKEYAQLLLKEVPIKKRYDLLLELYNSRAKLQQHKLRFFIDALMESLSKAQTDSFIRIVSKSLQKCNDDKNLRMYCHYFMNKTYSQIDKLSQLRIEDLMYKSIKEGQFVKTIHPITGEENEKCVSGALGTWVNDALDLLSNKKRIVTTLFQNTTRGEDYENYVFKYFSDALFSDAGFENWQVDLINNRLKQEDDYYYNALYEYIELFQDKEYIEKFGESFAECKKKKEIDQELMTVLS